MKLYTEEEVREAMSEARYSFTTEKSYDEIVKSLTPIELPSDEEIYNATPFHDDTEYSIGEHHGFKKGAKWVKDKILNQNK